MADLSLDDFIRKANVKVRISSQQGKGRGKPQQQQQQQQTVPNRNNVSRQPVKRFDARNRLGPKTFVDARDKIIVKKKSGAGDARNKIVQIQVQKGTFDARSLLQRQAGKLHAKLKTAPENFTVSSVLVGGPGTLRRTLSNPSAQGRAQVRLTNNGLLVTRPTQNTKTLLPAGGNVQVTNRRRSFEESLGTAVPIIQIRNDRYRQPAQHSVHQSQPEENYSHPQARQSSHTGFSSSGFSSAAYGAQPSGYRDYDDPRYNEASIAMLEIPKISVSNVRSAEVSAVRPAAYVKDYAQTRVPPGAATVSQGVKLPLSKTVLQPTKLAQAGVKRRPAQEVSGPLRLGKGGGPGIDLGASDPSPSKKIKMTSAGDLDEDLDSGVEVISPLQGFRVMVTNLFAGVTQDDIIELFGAVGPLKKAKLLKPGSAEVVYVSRDDAVSAVQKYHSRELDGQPMYVKMTTPVAAVVKKAVGDNDPDITGEALRLYKKGSGAGSLPETAIEIPTIHRALFKAGPPGPNKSVKFTVKI